jgi:TPP-dependent pyruvate/acetoin dehydrogenase alpha subunit
MSKLDKNELHELFYFIKLTRRLEEELVRLHGEGKVPGPLGFIVGREAMSVGAAFRSSASDKFVSSIASVGVALARGVQPVEIFNHFMGKSAGPTGGRDNAVFFGDFQRGWVAPASHLSTHLGVMAGIALAAKTKGESSVGISLMDGRGLETGDFHEGLNFAAVHRLPLVVVVEGATSNALSIDERMQGYGILGTSVDGMDVLQVLRGVETATDRARSGRGPTVIEARIDIGSVPEARPGSVPFAFPRGPGSDDLLASQDDNRMNDESWPLLTDPVMRFESFLRDHGLMGPEEHRGIVDRVEHLLESDLEKAEAESLPDSNILLGGVFGDRKSAER